VSLSPLVDDGASVAIPLSAADIKHPRGRYAHEATISHHRRVSLGSLRRRTVAGLLQLSAYNRQHRWVMSSRARSHPGRSRVKSHRWQKVLAVYLLDIPALIAASDRLLKWCPSSNGVMRVDPGPRFKKKFMSEHLRRIRLLPREARQRTSYRIA